MRDATLCFLAREKGGRIAEICLGMKKRGFGMGRWNGVGGKVGDHTAETVEEAVVREAREEIGVDVSVFFKVGELGFTFVNNRDWDMLVHVYFAKKWVGEPTESDEIRPRWFAVEDLPFDSMWPDDVYWLPKVLNGDLVKAKFVFGEGDVILEQELSVTEAF